MTTLAVRQEEAHSAPPITFANNWKKRAVLLLGLVALSVALIGKGQRITHGHVAPALSSSTKQQTLRPNHAEQHQPPRHSNHNNNNEPITIIVQLSGELGNQLGKWANGMCLAKLIRQRLSRATVIRLRAQEHRKWRRARDQVQQAFRSTRNFDFRYANGPQFTAARAAQRAWIQGIRVPKAATPWQQLMEGQGKDCNDLACLTQLVDVLNETWFRSDRPRNEAMTMTPATTSQNNNATSNTLSNATTNNKTRHFSIPHIYADAFLSDSCLEYIYEDIRAFFHLDRDGICHEQPRDDDTVLHLRNFLTEMPRAGARLGFEELNATQMAAQLFGNVSSNNMNGSNSRPPVAIISRFDNHIPEYIQALNESGWNARYIQQQPQAPLDPGNADFCFLASTRHEMVGLRISTFFQWAAILGNASRVRLYSVNSPRTRAVGRHEYTYHFTHPQLQGRFQYETTRAGR